MAQMGIRLLMGEMTREREDADGEPMSCPHCGADCVNHYRDAYVRHRVFARRGETLVLDGSDRTVLQYEKGTEVVCDECGRHLDFGRNEVEFVFPCFGLDPDALRRGFEDAYGTDQADPLAALPGGEIESFGEFAEGVVSRALHEWGAISAPAAASVRLVPLFPFGERLCPMVHVIEREEELAGVAISRTELENLCGIGLAARSLESAIVLCGCAVDAANEILRRPTTLVEFEE
jgi:hypothetical protein